MISLANLTDNLSVSSGGFQVIHDMSTQFSANYHEPDPMEIEKKWKIALDLELEKTTPNPNAVKPNSTHSFMNALGSVISNCFYYVIMQIKFKAIGSIANTTSDQTEKGLKGCIYIDAKRKRISEDQHFDSVMKQFNDHMKNLKSLMDDEHQKLISFHRTVQATEVCYESKSEAEKALALKRMNVNPAAVQEEEMEEFERETQKLPCGQEINNRNQAFRNYLPSRSNLEVQLKSGFQKINPLKPAKRPKTSA